MDMPRHPTLSLCKVVFTYEHVINTNGIDEVDTKRAECFVAVRPDFGEEPVRTAANIALLARIGPRSCWEKFKPMILSVEVMDSVIVESGWLS